MRKFPTVPFPPPRMFSVSSINIDDWMNFHVFGRLFRQLAENLVDWTSIDRLAYVVIFWEMVGNTDKIE
jgi:hypothetical protein